MKRQIGLELCQYVFLGKGALDGAYTQSLKTMDIAQSRKRFPQFFSQSWRAGDFPGGQVIFQNHLPSWLVMEKVKFEDCIRYLDYMYCDLFYADPYFGRSSTNTRYNT